MAGEADKASATFRIALEDATSGPAASSAASLEALRGKIEGDVVALRGLQQALRNLKGGGVAADSTIAGLKDRIAAQKATIAGAQAGYLKLGGTLGAIRKQGPIGDGGLGGLAKAFAAIDVGRQKQGADALKGLANAFREIEAAQKASAAEAAEKRTRAIAEASQLAGGRVAALANAFGKLRTLSGAAVAGGIALAAAILAVGAAAVIATKNMLEYGISVANARRNELLHLEGLAKIRNFWSGFSTTTKNAAATAGFLQQQIDAVSGSVAIGRDQVASYADQLYKMGLRGGNLQAALQGVATTAAVQGEAQAQAFAAWAAGANLTGQSVKALAADVKARLGGIAAAQLLSLDVQTRKLHESFAMLFSGIRIEDLLQGLSKITALFSQSTATGRALKAMAEVMLQPIIDAAGNGAPIVKRFFQGMVLVALDVLIALVRLRNWVRGAFGKDTWKGFDAGRVALIAGGAAAMGLAFALGLVAVAVGLIVAPFVVLGIAIAQVITWGAKLYDWFQAQNWSQLGSSIVDGIAKGLRGSVSKAWDAIKSLAQGLSDRFASVLGMHSPSRVFAMHGHFIAMGAAVGIDSGRAHAERAAVRLARGVERAGSAMGFSVGGYAGAEAGTEPAAYPAPMFAPTAAAGAGALAASGSGASISITGPIHVHASDAAGGRAAGLAFRQQLEEVLMGVNVHLGGRRPVGA